MSRSIQDFQCRVWCDIGATEGNDMALIFTQKVGRETRIIDCASEVGVGIDWMAAQLNEKSKTRGFVYANPAVLMPHDAGHPQASNAGAASFAQKFKQDYGFSCKVNQVTASVAWSIDQAKHFVPERASSTRRMVRRSADWRYGTLSPQVGPKQTRTYSD